MAPRGLTLPPDNLPGEAAMLQQVIAQRLAEQSGGSGTTTPFNAVAAPAPQR
jgi:hypothetical protein